jgi:uncharacterized protein
MAFAALRPWVGLDGRVVADEREAKAGGNAMSYLARVAREGVVPVVERPDAAKVISGDPVHTTWNVEEVDGLFCGLWQSTPGKWRVDFTEWEYVHIHAGVNVLTGDDGTVVTLRAGDSHIIRVGFRGTWEVLETTLKDYVIRG